MAQAANDRVNNLTLEDIIPRVVDTVNKSNFILRMVMGSPKTWNGRVVQEPITTTTSTLGQSFTGVQNFSTAIDFSTVNMSWYATGYAQPVTLSKVEQGLNNTPAGVISLYKASYEYAQNSMSTNLGTIFYGFGLGADFDGLGNIVDDGTNTTSYAGLARSTYGANINCGGSTGIIAASGGVLDFTTMDSADDAATLSGLASETPDTLVTTQAVWSLYSSLVQPQQMAMYQVMGGKKDPTPPSFGGNTTPGAAANFSGGATSLTYRGKDMLRDQKCPAGKMYFLNTKYFEFRSLKIPGLNTVATANTVTDGVYDKVTPTAFQFRDFMTPVNALSEVGIFVVYGNLINRKPRLNEVVTGITTT